MAKKSELQELSIKVTELKPSYYMFGGRGDVWSKTAHIANSGKHSTLCERPMLSTNWCRIEEVEEIGCQECLIKYNQEIANSK
jgi:hypothetical protein